MRKLEINENCNQCGVCVVKCPVYFAENEEGDVKVISENVSETDELTAAVQSCPVNAIQLGEEIDIMKSIHEYVNQLNTLKSGISVTRNDIAFHEAYTRPVYVPSAGVSRYEYRSSSQAERAGYDAFVSRCYSKIDNLILERITDYRVTEIKPYYTTDSNSIYYKNNQEISDILKAVSAAIGAEKFPNDFCVVDVYPDTNDTVWKMLNRGEIISDNFIGMVKREFDYSASEYKTYIDWDDMEDYRGRDVYNYNASEASRELGRDLGNALGYAKRDIEEASLGYIKGIVDSYNRKLKICLDNKISLIKSKTPNISIKNTKISTIIPNESDEVKLRHTADKYCDVNFRVFDIPKKYFEINWKFAGIDENMNYYNTKLIFNKIVIFVNINDIENI